jgi:hypothetical protein
MSAADPSKRVLMSMDEPSEFLKKPEKNSGSVSGKSKTLRLDLDLFEPDANNFPEFNYTKLVQIEKVIWTSEGRKKKKEKRIHFFALHCFAACVCFVVSHLSIRFHTRLRRDADDLGVVFWHFSCSHIRDFFSPFRAVIRKMSQFFYFSVLLHRRNNGRLPNCLLMGTTLIPSAMTTET